MNRILSSILLFAALCTCYGQSQDVVKYSDKQLGEDLVSLRKIMNDNHPSLYDFTPKKTFDSLFEVQRKNIRTTNSLSEAFQILGPLVARIGCSHSALRLGDHWDDATSVVLPIKVMLVGDTCVVTGSEDSQLKRGAIITKINGKSIGDILRAIGTWIPTDGNNPSARQFRIQSEFSDMLAIHEGLCKEYLVTCRDGQTIKTITMKARHWTPPSYSQAGSLRLRLVSATNTGILTIKTFGYYNRVDQFRQFIDSSFLALKKANTRNLIVDVRGNGGGDPWCSSYLLQQLIRKPFAYFEPIYGNYEPLSKNLAPAANGFSGKLFVLIDGGCSSSTGHLCALLKYHSVGKFVGSETGGTYTCNDNSGSFTLPNTGFTVRMARTRYTTKVEGVKRFQGIKPDVQGKVTSKDIILNTDGPLNLALELAAKM